MAVLYCHACIGDNKSTSVHLYEWLSGSGSPLPRPLVGFKLFSGTVRFCRGDTALVPRNNGIGKDRQNLINFQLVV